MTTNFSEKQIQEMQEFLWDGFCNADAVGVKIKDVLTGAKFVGAKLTDDQIQSVIDHYQDPEPDPTLAWSNDQYQESNWTEGDEAVKDMIADATDSTNGEKLYQWLAWVVGDQTADDMLEDWK